MARGIVNVSLLEKIDPYLCGDEDYRKDATYCDQENRQPVNLNEYSKSLDYVPFYTPEQVEFCQDYNDWFYEYDHSCATTSYELRQELRQIVEGRGKTLNIAAATARDSYEPLAATKPSDKPAAAAKPPDKSPRIPSPSEIYAMLTEDLKNVPPDQLRRLRKRRRQKAEKIHQQMVEIDKLLAQKDPEADTKIMALYQEMEDVCAEADLMVLKRVAHDCKGILDEHKGVKENWSKIKGAIGGAIGTVLFFFLRSGRGGKALKAMKKAWRENKGIMRILGVFDAYNKISKGVDFRTALERFADEFEDEVDRVPPPREEPGPIPGVDELGPVEEFLGPEGTPPVEEVSGPEGGYGLKSDQEMKELLQHVESAIRAFAGIARKPFSNDAVKEQAKYLLGVLDRAFQHNVRIALSNIVAPALHGEATLGAFEQLIGRFTQWFVKDYLSEVAEVAHATQTEIQHEGQQAAQRVIEGTLAELRKISETLSDSRIMLESLLMHLRDSTEGIADLMEVPNEDLVKKWHTNLAYVEGLVHDIVRIQTSLQATFILPANDSKIEERLEKLGRYNLGRLDFSLGFVESLNSSFADKHKVKIELELGEIEQFAIPKEMRLDLFRIINELVVNAIKNTDSAKKDRYVQIDADVDKDIGLDTPRIIRIIVTDNGVGIKDMEAATKRGKGLAIINELAKKHDLDVTFGLSSIGLEVTIEADISQWDKTPPNGAGTPPTSDASPSGTGSPTPAGNTNNTSARSMHSGMSVVSVGGLAQEEVARKTSSSKRGSAAVRAAYRRRKARALNGGMVPPRTPIVGPASAIMQGALQFIGVRPLPVAP